jgi:hypothetical protein
MKKNKSQLAKLLATENIEVQENAVKTASFDVKNRVLTIPVLKEEHKSLHVYDMLVGHEVSHALHTPADGWMNMSDRSDEFRSFVNVIEDARIDKLIQKKYPGLTNDYLLGFKKMYKDNFFGTKGRKQSDYALIDKINMYFKSSKTINFNFDKKENHFVKLVDACKSFKDVQVLQNQYDKLERMDAPTNVLKPMRVRMDELHFKAMKFAGLNNHADPKNLKNSDFVNYRGLKGMMTRKQAENYGTSLKFKDSLKNAEAMKTHWWVMGDAKDKKNWIKASKEAIRSRDKLSTRLPSIQNDPKISGTGIAKFGKPIHRLLGKITWQTSGKTALITAGIAGAVYAGYKAYDRYYSQAGKSCKGLKGSQRSKCVYMYKDKASNEAITKLKEALSGCQEKSDPDKCKMSIMRQLTKWRTRQKKYQQKLKKYNQ